MFTRLLTKSIFIFLSIACLPIQSDATSNSKTELGQMSIFDRLNQNEVAEITITADFNSLIDNSNSDDYIPASFSLKEGKSVLAFNIKVKPRGKYRRRVCGFPPLKLKFSKEDLNASGFSSFNKLKLVTHCLDDKEIGKELVMREYLTYELYRELSENSFRVQLAKLIYIDEKSGNKTRRWGFLIEPIDELAKRLNGEEVELMGQDASQFNTTDEQISSTFQYMIGNEDWSLDMNKNVKLIRTFGSEKLIPIPYDFDFSGLVNAPYAIPKSDFQLKSIRDRKFMGHIPSDNSLNPTFSYYRSNKKELIRKIYKFSYLSEASKVDIVDYIKSFYELISTENTVGTPIDSNL
jgi:hypothetical protein